MDAASLPLDGDELAMFQMTNSYRIANGLQPLQLSQSLVRAALWKSADMAAGRSSNHDDGFRSWDQRFKDCGFNMSAGWAMGENLVSGSGDGGATLQVWEHSTFHNANLLSPDFTLVGVKRVHGQGSEAGVWFWTMELGDTSYPDPMP